MMKIEFNVAECAHASNDTIKLMQALNQLDDYKMVGDKKWLRASYATLSALTLISTGHIKRIVRNLKRHEFIETAHLAEHQSDRTNYYYINKKEFDNTTPRMFF